MPELDDLRGENRVLRQRNEHLLEQVGDAERSMQALARGEVDAVVVEGSTTPVLLRAAQAKLRDSELLLRKIFDAALDAMLLGDATGTCIDANLAACELFNLSREQLVGRAIGELIGRELREPGEEGAIVDGGQTRRTIPLRRGDRAERVVDCCAVADVVPGLTLVVMSEITARVEAEQAIAKAFHEADLERRKLHAVLAGLPVGVWIADAEGRLLENNPAAACIWGGEPPLGAGPDGYGVYRAFWPGTGELVAPREWALVRTIGTGETIVAEPMEIARFDGGRAHVLNSTAPIRDEHGTMVGAVAVMLDVTEAHEAVREREGLIASLDFERRRLGALLAKAPACIAVLRGKDHVFELANELYQLSTGERELLGKPLLEAMPELRGQGLVELLDRVLATGEPYSAQAMPLRMVRRRGGAPEECYFNFVYQPIVEADGTRSGVFAHAIDVTEATVAQQRVRAQFHGVPVPTYVWQRMERDGKVQIVLADFNKAALTISNGRIAEYLGVSANIFFDDVPEVIEEIERCLSTGNTIQREMDRRLRSTGEVRRLFVTYAAAPPNLVIVHTEDITERAKLEEQLRQAQKMDAIGRLAGGVAHDFNNLLSVIISYADMAIDELEPGNLLREDMQAIQAAGQRATTLTRQLLAFSRQQVLQAQVIDLASAVGSMQSMLGRLLGEDVELVLAAAPGCGRVFADLGQIEQVVMNLAVNARDAMPDGGRLTMEVRNVEIDAAYVGVHPGLALGSYLMLAISDTGVGMDAATRARIFEPFFTTKDKGKGTGLGLAMVFGIVEQSGGQISVYSEPGHGTTFKVYLPRTDRSPIISLAAAPHTVLRGSETVLLVEDEEQVRVVASAILRRNGYQVLEASDGKDGFAVAEAFADTIDLLLTDVVMPRMSGRNLAEQLAASRPRMKVLFASGYTDDAIVHHGVLNAGVAFLQKPFTPDALLRRVREVLDASVALAAS